MGYFEATHFKSPHYQSVIPIKDNSVLRMIRNNEGYDVAKELTLSETSICTGMYD